METQMTATVFAGDAFQHQPLQRRLTKMYSDTKKSYESVTEPPRLEVKSELSSLHRKLQIQKNRLITWGIEWSDRSSSVVASEDIDESVEREGLSDVVGSVLSSIKDILEEAERMRYSTGTRKEQSAAVAAPTARSEKSMLRDHWAASDKPRFEELLKDLTVSIDTLDDLSRSRRFRQSTPQPVQSSYALSKLEAFGKERAGFVSGASISKGDGVGGMIPPAARVTGSTRSCESLRVDYSSLVIPDNGSSPSSRPPPYEAIASPSTSRMMAYFRRSPTSSHPWKKDGNRIPTVPVMIDYASIDPIFHDTGIYPSMARLENLVEAIDQPQHINRPTQTGFLNLLGYFEDPKAPRYGLVYELPHTVHSEVSEGDRPLESMTPSSLLSLLQSKSASGNATTPALDDRFRLAHHLAAALFHLHASGVMHRDVTSNHIVFFRPPPHPTRLPSRDAGFNVRHPSLTGFDLFTEYSFQTAAAPRPADLYRHPQDARLGGREYLKQYTPALDIYGLGLILLEIGLWMPLSSFWKPDSSLPTLKASTLSTLVRKLGARCGTTYMHAVDACLSIVNREPAGGEANAQDPKTQMAFYWEVVKRLDRCCMIEEDERQSPLRSIPEPVSQESAFPSGSSSKLGELRRQSEPIKTQKELPPPETSKTPEQPPKTPPSWLPMELFTKQPPTETKAKTAPLAVEQLQSTKRALRSPPQDAADQTKPKETTKRPAKLKLRVHPVKVSKVQLEEWHQSILPRLEQLLEKALKDASETFSIDLVGIGESAQTARPTIFISCSSPGRVKGILNRYFTYDKNLFDLKVRKGKLRRSAAKKSSKSGKKAGPARSMVQEMDEEPDAVNPNYYERPLCGASIGAYRDGEHSLAVSFGGVVMVDGDPHGMTVHHMLEPPSDEDESEYEDDEEDWEEPQHALRSSARPHRQPSSGIDRPSWTWREPYEGTYISDYSEEEADFDSDEAYESDFEPPSRLVEDESGSVHTEGDIPGVSHGDGEDYPVTQPALQDVEDGYYPQPEDMDEEHLASFHLGNVLASSGLRRAKKDGIYHEIDWALFKIKEERLQPHNLIQGGKRFCSYSDDWNKRPSEMRSPVCRNEAYREEDDLFPNRHALAHQLADMQVHSIGRTSGLKRGVISPAMSSVKVAGRTSSSRSWHVVGDFGIPGDSGAWVIDNEQGRVCGHVLAWCTEKAIAYICPMQMLFEDMERTLSRQITLPNAFVTHVFPSSTTAAAPSTALDTTAVSSRASVVVPQHVPAPASSPPLSAPSSDIHRAGTTASAAPPVEQKTIPIHADPATIPGDGTLRLSSPPPPPTQSNTHASSTAKRSASTSPAPATLTAIDQKPRFTLTDPPRSGVVAPTTNRVGTGAAEVRSRAGSMMMEGRRQSMAVAAGMQG